MKQGIKRAHVEAGNQSELWRPLNWRMIKKLEGYTVGWVIRGIVVWMDLAPSQVLLLRALELSAEDRGGSTKCIA